MVKLVRGQDNVISLHITSTYPVGEVSGTFVAKSVTIPVPQSRNGTEIKVAAADVEAIGEDFMIGVMTLKNEANEEVAVVRVPLAVLPEGSDNRGFTDVRITLVSIREVEGGDHGGAGVKMFPTKDDFPVKGNVRYIYLAENTGKMYRWDAATEDYVEVSGVVHANLAENNPENDGYVLNRQTSFLYNDGWDGTHPYASVANFVPDYDPATTYAKNDVVFHEFKSDDTTDNGIFRCLADGTTVAPPDASRWIEIDLKDLLGKKEVVVSDDGETPTDGEEIWIDETEAPDGQSYNDLVDKPQINGHELTSNKTSRQLGIVDTTDLDKKLSKQRVDGDATKGQVEWEELDDHSGCLKVTGVVKGTNVETADGNHNLADKADKATTLAGYGITDAVTKTEIAAKADLVDGKVPAAQLPSYVDDVLEYDTMSAFPATGESGKIYVAKDTSLVYRWSGTQYVEISPSPTLDDTVTAASPNGVKSSGIWSAIWGMLSELPAGFTSIYDWVMFKLYDKADKSELEDSVGALSIRMDGKLDKADVVAPSVVSRDSQAADAKAVRAELDSILRIADEAARDADTALYDVGETKDTLDNVKITAEDALGAAERLEKSKVGSFESVGGASATIDNGVAKLEDFFTESNSLLNGRLAYSRNATGLKDRAFNALTFDGTEYNLSTALAAVTPTASGQPRDLLIVAAATAATTISFTAGTIKGDKPTIDGVGTWLITLTEYAANTWYCRQIKMEDAA